MVANVCIIWHLFKGLGLWRRRVNFCMQLRSWLGQVKATCPLEDIGFLCQRHWVQPVHQSSVKVNGVFLAHLILWYINASLATTPTGLRHSEARLKTKARHVIGMKKTNIFWYASVYCALLIMVPANHQMNRIASLDVDNESDIDWKNLSNSTWNMWSGHFLQQKWRQLKASCNANGVMCHRGEYMMFISHVYSI